MGRLQGAGQEFASPGEISFIIIHIFWVVSGAHQVSFVVNCIAT